MKYNPKDSLRMQIKRIVKNKGVEAIKFDALFTTNIRISKIFTAENAEDTEIII